MLTRKLAPPVVPAARRRRLLPGARHRRGRVLTAGAHGAA